MKEVNMKPEEIANLVVLSREKGYAIIIPQDALYLVSKAFQKLISQRDTQIAKLSESHAQIVEARDMYKRLLNRTAPPAPVKLPRVNHPAQFDYADKVAEILKANGLRVAGHEDE